MLKKQCTETILASRDQTALSDKYHSHYQNAVLCNLHLPLGLCSHQRCCLHWTLFGTEYLEVRCVLTLLHRSSERIPDDRGMRLEAWLEVCSGRESYAVLPIAFHVCLWNPNDVRINERHRISISTKILLRMKSKFHVFSISSSDYYHQKHLYGIHKSTPKNTYWNIETQI